MKHPYIFGLMLLYIQAAGQTSQGPRSGTVFSNDNSEGRIAWSSPSNAQSSDNSRTTAGAILIGDSTNILTIKGFGFAIPSSATITGIVVSIEQSGIGVLQAIVNNRITLIKGGTMTGFNAADGTLLTIFDHIYDYGSSSLKWGSNWTPAEINSAEFGVSIGSTLYGVSVLPTARIDHVTITVYYNTSLPVDLINFNIIKKPEGALLEWTTSSEIGIDSYDISRSTNGKDWTLLTSITASRNAVNQYKWLDNNPYPNCNYYRLHPVNIDGTEEKMHEKVACMDSHSTQLFYIDMSKEMIVSINDSEKEHQHWITILTITGEILYNKPFYGTTIQIEKPRPGYYLVRVQCESELQSDAILITE